MYVNTYVLIYRSIVKRLFSNVRLKVVQSECGQLYAVRAHSNLLLIVLTHEHRKQNLCAALLSFLPPTLS